MRLLSVVRALAGLGMAAPLLAACGPSTGASTVSAHQPGAIRVVAGESVWGNIAVQIGGRHAAVSSIVTDPNTDPHAYESDPVDAIAVSRAGLVIENGAGYDAFLNKVVAAAGAGRRVLDLARTVGVTGPDPNPHLWYSPTYVPRAAAAIEGRLAAADPADAPAFAANLQTFLASYEPYSATIAAIRARYAGRAISYTERVPGYLIDAAGLRLGTPVGFSRSVEDGTDPTPADTAAFDQDLSAHRVQVLLYNAQVVDAQTTTIEHRAIAAGIPVVGVSEMLPARCATFQAWQIAQAQALLTALGG